MSSLGTENDGSRSHGRQSWLASVRPARRASCPSRPRVGSQAIEPRPPSQLRVLDFKSGGSEDDRRGRAYAWKAFSPNAARSLFLSWTRDPLRRAGYCVDTVFDGRQSAANLGMCAVEALLIRAKIVDCLRERTDHNRGLRARQIGCLAVVPIVPGQKSGGQSISHERTDLLRWDPLGGLTMNTDVCFAPIDDRTVPVDHERVHGTRAEASRTGEFDASIRWQIWKCRGRCLLGPAASIRWQIWRRRGRWLLGPARQKRKACDWAEE